MQTARKREFKNSLFEQFARAAKALANGRRLELVELLAQRDRTVEDLAELAGLSTANASQHLKILREAALVEARREGLFIRYRLASDRVFALWQALRDFGAQPRGGVERIVDAYLKDRSALQAVSIAQLEAKMRTGRVTVIDVRPADEFAAGHIAGARNVPVAELEARLGELPRTREIVAYCRGPYCVFADEAVALLNARGLRAARLESGFPDWKAEGLPVQ